MPSPSRLPALLGFALVASAWAFFASRAIDLPGVYMDAVNPDYLVARVLNPHPEPMTAWVLRGNYLLGGRVPILVSVYHGTQQFWLGLPLFWLFGTTVEGLRITHAVFGLGVLAALYGLLLAGGLRPWLAALAAGALAVDPAFLYAFRSQSHITMAPAAWLLLAVLLLERARGGEQSPRALGWSGFFAGLSIFGYFVYAFFLPALLAGVLLWPRSGARQHRSLRAAARWCGGLVLGVGGYVLGYALIARREGGIGGFLAFLAREQQGLGAFASPLSLADRVRFDVSMVVDVVGNAWHHSLMFAEYGVMLPGTPVKLALLVLAPLALLAIREWRRSATPLQRLVVALPVSFCLVALVFGGRLGGHHFMSLLPIGYAGLALGLAGTASEGARARTLEQAAALGAFALLVAVNVVGQQAEMTKLLATRGVGLFSDAINRFADDLGAESRKPFVFFPDWGLALPVAFLTRATVATTSEGTPELGRRLLCEGRDVAIALIDGDRAARRDQWQAALGWDSPAVKPYRQADGRIVFEVATFAGSSVHPSCSAGGHGTAQDATTAR